ncbi:MAG: lipoate--protein ligase [Angelakisella sp.]
MIKALYTVRGQGTNPYENLALEELLLREVQPGECMLYLWQNDNTVVVGRNQNCRAECRIDLLEADGGFLARRLSGGGTVFHDKGNLNFTFLLPTADYDLARQTEVILQAVRLLGQNAERTGRNDIAVDGRKFSGNAFHHSRQASFHHGTIMISADVSRFGKYLTVAEDKLQSHGVKSVRSRVVNLAELDSSITVERVEQAMHRAFGQVYGAAVQPLPDSRINADEWNRLTEKFASWQWRIGDEPAASCVMTRRFPWGGVELYLTVTAGKVSECALYTDALEDGLPAIVAGALVGAPYTGEGLSGALHGACTAEGDLKNMVGDLQEMLRLYGAPPRRKDS